MVIQRGTAELKWAAERVADVPHEGTLRARARSSCAGGTVRGMRTQHFKHMQVKQSHQAILKALDMCARQVFKILLLQ